MAGVLVIDAMGFPGMSRLDGAADGVIDIYGLLANADASTNLTAEFMSASGAAFTVTAGRSRRRLSHHLCRWPRVGG